MAILSLILTQQVEYFHKLLQEEKMSYLYVTDDKFARKPNTKSGYICYRTVICHALFYHMREDLYSADELKRIINQIRDAFNQNQVFKHHVLEVFPFQFDDQNIGFILVDKSHGCYPLIFYPQQQTEHATRTQAILNVMDDLVENIDKIIQILENYEKWTEATQNDLQDIFNYKEED